jgi:hypothetical protein
MNMNMKHSRMTIEGESEILGEKLSATLSILSPT